MNNLTEEQALMRLRQMRLRGRKKPRHSKRSPLKFNTDVITEMELRVRCVERWLKEDMSINTIIKETRRPEWWVRDWMKAGFPLFDFPRGKRVF
jgi:hypothetical protein